MTVRRRWILVSGVTAAFPVLVHLLYPIFGSSTFTLSMLAPVLGTYFFGLAAGLAVMGLNVVIGATVMTHIADISPEAGIPRSLIPLVVKRRLIQEKRRREEPSP